MRFYLKPESGAKIIFTVLDSEGSRIYEVAGNFTSIGCRYILRGADGVSVARITGVSLPASFRYSVNAGGSHMRITVKPNAPRRAVLFKGVSWRFRGSVITRSFDIVEDRTHMHPRAVMTHGRCWNSQGDCYGVEVRRESDIPLALCAAVAIDCAVIGGCASPVPAG